MIPKRTKLTHEVHENTWKRGELKLYFSPSAGGLKKKKIETKRERKRAKRNIKEKIYEKNKQSERQWGKSGKAGMFRGAHKSDTPLYSAIKGLATYFRNIFFVGDMYLLPVHTGMFRS